MLAYGGHKGDVCTGRAKSKRMTISPRTHFTIKSFHYLYGKIKVHGRRSSVKVTQRPARSTARSWASRPDSCMNTRSSEKECSTTRFCDRIV